MDLLLGLDLGTTNCKALAFDRDGRLVGSASAPTPAISAPGTGSYAPMIDPEALWQASARLIHQVVNQLAGRGRVAALAVASMAESGVLVDRAGTPLAPVLTWHDRRTLPWVDWWRERVPDAAIYAATGLPQDHIYSAHKLLWHRQQDPTTFARAAHWLCLPDWILFRLTGVPATDFSIACRTMLFDLRTLAWSDDLLELAELPAGLMPSPYPSGRAVGQVTPAAASLTGLAAGTPVATGGHDHICAALAAGATAPGVVQDSSGTTETIMAALDRPLLRGPAVEAGLGCGCHTAPGRFYLIGGIMSGAVVDWLLRTLGGMADAETLAGLTAEAEGTPPLANGVGFLPYLGGSGPPHRDADAWGAWLGLRLHHGRGDLMRAAMEGLSFAIRYLLEGHQRVTGQPVRELRAVGGGTRNTWWQQLKADVLGLPIEVPEVGELAAGGAALLAGIAVGVYADAADAATHTYRAARRYDPDPALHARYDAAYRDVFLNLYPHLRSLPLAAP